MTHTKAVTNNNPSAANAGSDPQPAPVTPEQVVEQLRAVRATMGQLAALSPSERKRLVGKGKLPAEVVQAQINMIDASEEVVTALGSGAEDLRTLADTSSRWTAVEDELRVILAAVEARNLVDRHALSNLTSRATNLAVQLARDPKHAPVLGTHVQEIRRLKRLARRKKAAQPTPGSPAPSSRGTNGIISE